MAEELDIITKLGGKGMIDHIMDKIFGCLDLESLQNAESTSQDWKCIIKNGKFWEALLKRNVSLSMDWKQMLAILKSLEPMLLVDAGANNSQGQYRRASSFISKKLKVLEENWKSVSYVEQQCCWEPPASLLFPLSNHFVVKFKLSIPWIISVSQNGQEILLRNRFIQKAPHQILTLPIMRINLSQTQRKLRIFCLTANEQFIVATFYHHAEVCVWSAVTTELLWVLGGDVFDDENWRESHDDVPEFTPAVHCLWDSFLLIFQVDKIEMEKTLTLWKLHSTPDNDDPVIQRRKVLTDCRLFLDMHMDCRFAVMLTYPLQDGSCYFRIESRSLETLDLIAMIIIQDTANLFFFHYNSGIVVTGMEGKIIQVWNAATGEQLRSIAYRYSLSGIQLIKDKYMVTCDKEGTVKIWDLTAALDPNVSSSRLLLRILQTPQNPLVSSQWLMDTGVFMQADNYQVALLIPFDRQSSYLYTKDFVGDWHEEFKPKKASKRAKPLEDYSD